MEHKIVGIRADGSADIGMGHLMRCLSIAAALLEKNIHVIFFTNNIESAAFIQEKGFSCKVVKKEADMERELPYLLPMLIECNIKVLLIDSYHISTNYMRKLKEHVKVIYLDDIATNMFPADGVINYNIYGDLLPYKDFYKEEAFLLLGSEFAPVKREFSEMNYRIKEQVETILITMGGSDALNIAGQLGEALLNSLPKHIRLILVCGRFSPHYSSVKALEKKSTRITVLTDVKDMWNVMACADIAVAAAGSTMYELCTLGVPSVCCYYVENQRLIAEAFGNRTSMINAGDFSKNPKHVLEKMEKAVISLINDFNKRKVLSEEMHKITDGKGAYRIADYLDGMLASRQVL